MKPSPFFHCPQCKKTIKSTIYAIRRHLACHFRQIRCPIQPYTCKKNNFTVCRDLRKHIDRHLHHNKNTPLRCYRKRCLDELFQDSDSLSKHVWKYHAKVTVPHSLKKSVIGTKKMKKKIITVPSFQYEKCGASLFAHKLLKTYIIHR